MAVTAERCAAQLLGGGPAGSAGEVAGRLLAIQAQDLRGARLAVRARSAGLSASDVDSALARRSLVVTWLNRGTLYLVRSEDYWWLHPLTTPQLRAGHTRTVLDRLCPCQQPCRWTTRRAQTLQFGVCARGGRQESRSLAASAADHTPSPAYQTRQFRA